MQGSKLQLTGRQSCDQKLSTGDLSFRTGRQLATCVLSVTKENHDTTFVSRYLY